jgi:hypothetical protein
MGTLGHGGQAQSVTITGSITPDLKHACDKCADIFAFGEYFPYEEGKLGDNTCPPSSKEKGAFYAMAKSPNNDRDLAQPRNYQLWDGKPATLPILYQGVTLKAGEAVEYILYEGPFDARGCLNIGFGYRVKVGNDYEIVYNHHAATVDNTMGATIRKK